MMRWQKHLIFLDSDLAALLQRPGPACQNMVAVFGRADATAEEQSMCRCFSFDLHKVQPGHVHVDALRVNRRNAV